MCRIMEELRDEGLREGLQEVARRLLSTGKYALDEIASISGLSLDEVKRLAGE